MGNQGGTPAKELAPPWPVVESRARATELDRRWSSARARNRARAARTRRGSVRRWRGAARGGVEGTMAKERSAPEGRDHGGEAVTPEGTMAKERSATEGRGSRRRSGHTGGGHGEGAVGVGGEGRGSRRRSGHTVGERRPCCHRGGIATDGGSSCGDDVAGMKENRKETNCYVAGG
jgi:hypothetical protein